jgi:hypothetical protein
MRSKAAPTPIRSDAMALKIKLNSDRVSDRGWALMSLAEVAEDRKKRLLALRKRKEGKGEENG